MLSNIHRARVIQVWFAALALVIVAGMAVGPAVTAGTAAMLLALSIVPPLIVFMLWPAAETVSVADVLRGTDRRQ